MSQLRDRRVAFLFLILATAVFIARGPMRTLKSGDDLVPQYGGARAWVLGKDPYSRVSLGPVLRDAGRETNPQGQPIFNWSLYPPPTLAMMSPLAILSWPEARVGFLLITLLLFAWQLRSLMGLAELRWSDVAGVWLVGSVVALAPYHTGIALLQMAIPSAALVVVGLELLRREEELKGGTVLGFAALFKPQLAAPFILYVALRRHGRGGLIAAGVCAVATLVGIAWLELHDVGWLESWQYERIDVSRPGGHHDPAGPWSAQLLELRTLITAVTGLQRAGAIGFAIAALLGILLYILGRDLDRRHDLLLASGVAVLTLLATYHRFYDAALLVLPMAWAISTVQRPSNLKPYAVTVIACTAVFFAPGAWMLQRFANEDRIPAEWTNDFWWNGLLLRHQNWALVTMCVALLSATAIARRNDIDSRRAAPF